MFIKGEACIAVCATCGHGLSAMGLMHESPSAVERLREPADGVAAVEILIPLRPSRQTGFEEDIVFTPELYPALSS